MYKYPHLYHDLIRFYSVDWQVHQHLPKAFQHSTGEMILTEISQALGRTAAANLASRNAEEARRAADDLQAPRLGLEKIRAYLTLAWDLNFISHPQMADLGERLDGLGRQAASWRGWLGKR
ncbi:MAG: hypothetical protein LBO66_06345 [Deltaproteobacteria bacterium]|jgi:hypothetical protein|nr:hypothetical protein [Deltaproteobacteria bacterium]